MQKNRFFKGFYSNLLNRTGGWFIVATIAIAQFISLPGTLLGVMIVQLNVELPQAELLTIATLALILLIVTNIVLQVITYLSTRYAFARLNKWMKKETLTTGSPEELSAWREITRLPWRYSLNSLIISLLVIAVPIIVYLNLELGLTGDDLIYTGFGSFVAAISVVVISSLTIERNFTPAREILIPRNFEAQIAGATGLRVSFKFQIATIALIMISILLIAPIGYSSVIKVINTPINSIEMLARIQAISILGSLLAVVFGLVVSYLLASSVSRPVNDLVDVFGKVEKGQLSTRARIVSTDEVGELALYFNRMISRLEVLQQNLESEVTMRTAQLEASNEIARIVSSILDPDELVKEVVNLVTDKFGYYYAALFLIDDSGTWAELIDATGSAGKILKERRHRLSITGKSMVGSAITNRKARITLEAGEEQIRFDNPLLPETRSEIALPLMVGDRVLGVLDVQSRKSSAFGEKDISILQSMANQVAIAIENARLFKATQTLLEETRSTNRQYMADSWNAITRTTGKIEYETRMPAPPSHELFGVEVPLAIRDQVLGKVTLEGETDWTPEQKNLLESVATQAAFALENARLLNESQQTALRERLMAAITERIWSSQSIDGILQTAVRELGRALEVSEASIELKIEE